MLIKRASCMEAQQKEGWCQCESKATVIQHSSSPTSNIMLLSVRSFGNMDEPGACVQFRSEFRGRFCKRYVKKVTSLVREVQRQ